MSASSMILSACLLFAGAALAATPAPSPFQPPPEGSIRGITEPFRSLILKPHGKRQPPWSGRIAKVLVQEGDIVEVGQVLVELDHSEEEIEARLRKLIADSDAELRSAVERERTLGMLADAARKLYERTKSISKEDVEKKDLEYRLAVAEKERLQTIEERERLESEMATESLAKRVLRAPIRGVIARVFLREGESCEPVDPLVQLVDVSRGYFNCNVEEKLGRTLTKGQTVQLRLQAGSEFVPVNGTVSFVAPVVDPSSGLMLVKVEFENPQGNVRPGVAGLMIPPVK